GRLLRPELDCSRHEQSWLRDDAIGVLDPFAHPSPGVARIDHLLHLEPVERTDGPPRAFDARVDLGSQRCGVRGLGQLAFVGGFDPALGRAAGHATRALAPLRGVAKLLPATPKLRLMMTVKIGTVTCANAIIHSPPLRIVPAISCSSPTANP